MLLVSSYVPIITWLCSHVMWFQWKPTNWPLLTRVSSSSVVRASALITEGHGFKSHLRLRPFSKFYLHLISYTLKYLKFKPYTITLKAVLHECRVLNLKNVIDLFFKYPHRLCVPYITW